MTESEKKEAMMLCRLYGPNNCWTGGTGRMASLLFKALGDIEKMSSKSKRWGVLDRLHVKIKQDF